MTTSSHTRLRAGQPVWLPGRGPNATHARLSGRHRADVVIVGGGITGAIAALRFVQAGNGVVLLEADRVGLGSTAASSALLLQEPDRPLVGLTERFGSPTARRLWRLSHDAARDLIETLAAVPTGCRLERRDTIYYTTDGGDVADLAKEQAARHRAGFETEWLTPGALRVEAGIPAQAGLRMHGNAQCDPYRACLGVIREAVRLGARVHERSPVRRIEPQRRGVVVRTAAGVVEADQVVVATGYATPQFRPLAGRFEMARTYVLATAPLDADARRELGLPDVMLWDTRQRYHYARWTSDRRLLLGGGDRPLRGGGAVATRLAHAIDGIRGHFERILPALGNLPITHAWEGRFANTPDSLPYVGPHRRYPRHLFALGYGGNGMTFGSLAGRLLVGHYQGRTTRDHALFAFDR